MTAPPAPDPGILDQVLLATSPQDIAKILERETADWDHASRQRLLDTLTTITSPDGWKPFYCPQPDCDGKPHGTWRWNHARGDQHPPRDWGEAFVWLMLSGRGAGKSRTASEWAHRLARSHPGAHLALVAPIASDARDVMVEGPSGILRTAHPLFTPEWEPTKRKLTWPNGAYAHTYSGDVPDRLRGPQHHFAIVDEIASFGNELEGVWDNLLLGLRLGEAPKILVTSTPRPLDFLRELVASDTTVTVRVSTYRNLDNLAPTFRETVLARYEGTELGRQELYGEILEDLTEAMWLDSDIHRGEIPEDDIGWHVIGVDPAVTSGPDSDATGIVVAAATAERDIAKRKVVVVDDFTVAGRAPEEWARVVVDTYRNLPAPTQVVVEGNQGGDLLVSVLHQVDPNLPVTRIHSHKAKDVRADPVVLAYRLGRVVHRDTPTLKNLETEMTSWVPGLTRKSPDRIDALVNAVTALAIDPKILKAVGGIQTFRRMRALDDPTASPGIDPAAERLSINLSSQVRDLQRSRGFGV